MKKIKNAKIYFLVRAFLLLVLSSSCSQVSVVRSQDFKCITFGTLIYTGDLEKCCNRDLAGFTSNATPAPSASGTASADPLSDCPTSLLEQTLTTPIAAAQSAARFNTHAGNVGRMQGNMFGGSGDAPATLAQGGNASTTGSGQAATANNPGGGSAASSGAKGGGGVNAGAGSQGTGPIASQASADGGGGIGLLNQLAAAVGITAPLPTGIPSPTSSSSSGGYASASGASGSSSGSGSSDSNGSQVADGSLGGNLNFGNADGKKTGGSQDPGDSYWGRLDKNANLFEVIHTRYQSKGRSWVVEDLESMKSQQRK